MVARTRGILLTATCLRWSSCFSLSMSRSQAASFSCSTLCCSHISCRALSTTARSSSAASVLSVRSANVRTYDKLFWLINISTLDPM